MSTTTPTTDTKPWYQSKIFIIAGVLAMTGLTNLYNGFILPHISADQVTAIQALVPKLADLIQQLQSGGNILSVTLALVPIILAIFRVNVTQPLSAGFLTKATTDTPPVETKPWYQSKIFIIGAVLAFTGISNLFTHWILPYISPDQVAVIQASWPKLADVVKQIQSGGNIVSIAITLAGILFSLWRVNTGQPLSLKKGGQPIIVKSAIRKAA